MRFTREARFDTDFKALRREHQQQFIQVIAEKFNPACDAFAQDSRTQWPASLRVKPMRNAPGIFEMTWSFTSPDGRATFQLLRDDRGIYCRWRRVGDYSVFKQP